MPATPILSNNGTKSALPIDHEDIFSKENSIENQPPQEPVVEYEECLSCQ